MAEYFVSRQAFLIENNDYDTVLFVRRVCDPGTEVRVVPGLGEHSAAIRSEFAG